MKKHYFMVILCLYCSVSQAETAKTIVQYSNPWAQTPNQPVYREDVTVNSPTATTETGNPWQSPKSSTPRYRPLDTPNTHATSSQQQPNYRSEIQQHRQSSPPTIGYVYPNTATVNPQSTNHAASASDSTPIPRNTPTAPMNPMLSTGYEAVYPQRPTYMPNDRAYQANPLLAPWQYMPHYPTFNDIYPQFYWSYSKD